MFIWYCIATDPETGEDYGEIILAVNTNPFFNDYPSECCLMIPPATWDCV